MNQLKESISYLDGPFVHFPVLVDVKDLMLLCCGWNRRREKFGLLHIVCKTVQLRAFFEGRDQLVSGEQTTQFWCNLQKKKDKKNYSNNSISKCLFDNSGRNRKACFTSVISKPSAFPVGWQQWHCGCLSSRISYWTFVIVLWQLQTDTSNRHSKVYSILVYISLDGTTSGRDSKITTWKGFSLA